MREVADDTAGGGWDLLVPRGWASIPTAPEPAAASIRRVLDRRFRGTARDELVTARIELDRSLRSLVAQARAQGSEAVHVLLEPVAGVPVSASLVVSRFPVVDGVPPAGLMGSLRGGEGVVEHGPIELGAHRAVRRRRRARGPLGAEPDAPQAWHTSVEYVVDVGAEGLLLLTFSTVTDQVADELVALFDAMASTLRSRPARPDAG